MPLSVKVGPATGGTVVTVTSSERFLGVTAVKVGGVPVPHFTVGPGGSTLTFTTPPGTPGNHEVTVEKSPAPGGRLEVWSIDLGAVKRCGVDAIEHMAPTFADGLMVVGPEHIRAEFWAGEALAEALRGDYYVEFAYHADSTYLGTWPSIFEVTTPGGAHLYAYRDLPSMESVTRIGEGRTEAYQSTYGGIGEGEIRLELRRVLDIHDSAYLWDRLQAYNGDVAYPAFNGAGTGMPPTPVDVETVDLGGPNGYETTSTSGTILLGGPDTPRGRLSGTISYFRVGILSARTFSLGHFRYYGSAVNPRLRYRAYRSDDLSRPIYGPINLDIDAITMKRDGSNFTAKAPSLNYARTGEVYDLDRFPGLRGFLT